MHTYTHIFIRISILNINIYICIYVRQRTRVPREELLKDVTVVARCNDRRRLIKTEAIIIKEEGPALHTQAEGYDRLLKIFHPLTS